MGLAILPARLKEEMSILADAIVEGKNLHEIDVVKKHADWVEEWIGKYEITPDSIMEILHVEIAKRFVEVLECAGVFKRTKEGNEAFGRFLAAL